MRRLHWSQRLIPCPREKTAVQSIAEFVQIIPFTDLQQVQEKPKSLLAEPGSPRQWLLDHTSVCVCARAWEAMKQTHCEVDASTEYDRWTDHAVDMLQRRVRQRIIDDKQLPTHHHWTLPHHHWLVSLADKQKELAATLWWFTAAPKSLKIQVF